MFYSQFGEDRILFDIFKGKKHGTCIEVGANDGVNDSTSYFFEKLGWNCILVEPNPDLCRQIRSVRNGVLYEYAASSSHHVTTLYIAEGAERAHGVSTISDDKEIHNRIKNYRFSCRPVAVQTKTLDEMLLDAQISADIDFISIDVEGHELEVLEGFAIEKWKPTIILVEDNSNYESNIVSNYLKKYGYVRFKRTGVNDWYSSRKDKQLVNLKNRASYCLGALITKSINRLRKNLIVMRLKKLLKQLGIW